MEHALHLAAKHFVEDVAPTSAGKLLTKVKEAMANATEGGDGVDLDSLNIELNGIEAEMSRDEDVNVTVYELLKWIRTRWASLFHMLERILLLRKVSILL